MRKTKKIARKILADNRTVMFFDVAMSLLGAVGVARVAAFGVEQAPMNSFLILLIAILLFLFRRKAKTKNLKANTVIISACFSLILSGILVIGRQLELMSAITWSLGTIFSILALFCFIYIITTPLIIYISKTTLKKNLTLAKKQKIIIFCVIFAVNIIYWLALYPGIYGWDSALMAHKAITNTTDAHYSVILGELFGFMLQIGRDVFGDISIGLAILTLLQVIIMSYIYSRVVYFVAEITKNKNMTWSSVVFFVIIPFMPAMTVYSTQDTFFGGVFALIFIELYRVATNEEYWNNKKHIVKYIVLSILLCLFRNNGLHVLFVVAIMGLLMLKNKKRSAFVLLTPIALILLITGPLYNLIGIKKPSAIKETLSVPSQQLARTYMLNEELLTPEERQEIEYFYSENDNFKRYLERPMIADFTKSSLHSEAFSANSFRYISLWMKIGLKHPLTYIEAFLLNSIGTWYPNKNFNDGRSNAPYIEYDMNTLWEEQEKNGYGYLRIDRDSKIPLVERILSHALRKNGWKNIPFLSTIASIGTYFILVLFLVGVILKKKNYMLFVPLSLVFGLYITVLLAPVSVFRYCYPVAILVPVFYSLLFNRRSIGMKTR